MLLNNFTLLYVEDDQDTQEILKDILELKVKELYIASDGEEGLEFYKKYNPDMVLTDIGMPNMNGIEMSEAIKLLNPHQPIAVLTAFNEPSFLKQAVNLGVDKYILKPVADIELFFKPLESIAKVLQSDLDREKLEHMLQTQSKVTAMGEMIENIAHQWRQPLSIITTHASGLNMKMDFNENITKKDIEKCSNDIIVQADYLSKTIDDFRNFFKEGNGVKKEFNLKDTIEKVILLIDDSYKSNFIKIITNVDDCIIHQNENQLSQALLNIFNNAKDAFKINNIKGNRYFFIDIKQNDEKITITLKDNAGGIPKDAIDKVFEPYFTTKFKHQGTGIGLYMTNQIITKHFNGTIDASNDSFEYESEEYVGACFSVVLPLEL